MKDETGIFRKLQKHLDQMPIGFPATESGVEIRILKHLFTPEEAAIAVNLSALPEPIERIHARVKGDSIPIEELEALLDGLVAKGAILSRKRRTGGQEVKQYSKAMLAVGMYEFQVDRLTKELQQDVTQYMEEAFGEAFHSKKTSQMRTIPINETVTIDRRVGTYDDAKQLVESCDGPFAVINCVCRQGKDLVGEPCRQTDVRRACLTLKGVARSCIESGTGQALTQKETLRLLEKAEQIGMVLQPENTQNPNFICCCCGCCCGVLTSAKRLPRPAQYFHANYYAEVDPELCTSCETCLERCQLEALTMLDEVSQVDRDQCIGCGLCVSTCPSGAVQLVKKEEQVIPPKDQSSLYRKILVERYGVLGTAKFVGKSLLKMKI